MGSKLVLFLLFRVAIALLGVSSVKAEDAYKYFTWTVTYGTLAPLGVPQQVANHLHSLI